MQDSFNNIVKTWHEEGSWCRTRETFEVHLSGSVNIIMLLSKIFLQRILVSYKVPESSEY